MGIPPLWRPLLVVAAMGTSDAQHLCREPIKRTTMKSVAKAILDGPSGRRGEVWAVSTAATGACAAHMREKDPAFTRQLDEFHSKDILDQSVSVKVISNGEQDERLSFKLVRSHVQRLVLVWVHIRDLQGCHRNVHVCFMRSLQVGILHVSDYLGSVVCIDLCNIFQT